MTLAAFFGGGPSPISQMQDDHCLRLMNGLLCCFGNSYEHPMGEFVQSNRLIHLEAARGIASIIVVFHHFVLGFIPMLKGSVMHGGLKGTPLYILANGTGAVAFFFVLSGFVLTQSFYRRFTVAEFAASVLKRLPRLMLPAALSIAIGAAILIMLPETYRAAGQITGSQWLATFANAKFPQNFVPSFTDAAQHSLLVFILPNHFEYNSNLWTMVYEFYGSLLVFALAAISVVIIRDNQRRVVTLHILVGILCIPASRFLPFVIGSLLAFLYVHRRNPFRLPRWVSIALLLGAIAGFCVNNWGALVFASSATMILLLGIPSLANRLSGPIGVFLGVLSFPLYLVHVLVLLSVTSTAYLALTDYGVARWVILLACLVTTWAVSLAAALPLVVVERKWVKWINQAAHSLVRRIPFLNAASPTRQEIFPHFNGVESAPTEDIRYEAEMAFEGADLWPSEGAGSRCGDGGTVPPERDAERGVLKVEGQV